MGKPRKPDFSSAFLKLYRAKAHIEEFKAAANEFFEGKVHSARPQLDPVSGRYGYVIGGRAPPPGFALMVGDAIHNLRSSLDHLIAACAIANHGDEEDTHFPISKRKADLMVRLKKDIVDPGAGQLAADLVLQVKPYRRANGALFAMHKLDLADKHRLIVAVKHTLHVAITLEAEGSPTFGAAFSSASKERRFIPIPAELVDRILPAEVSYTSDIVFGPTGYSRGKPCIEELARFLEATESVLTLFRSSF